MRITWREAKRKPHTLSPTARTHRFWSPTLIVDEPWPEKKQRPADPSEKTRHFCYPPIHKRSCARPRRPRRKDTQLFLPPTRSRREVPEPITSEGCVCHDIQVTRLGKKLARTRNRKTPGRERRFHFQCPTSTRSEHLQCARARVKKKTSTIKSRTYYINNSEERGGMTAKGSATNPTNALSPGNSESTLFGITPP